MAGIIFLGTCDLDAVKDFYINTMGMKLWLEQAECSILKHGNLLLGFCKRDQPDTQGIITFYFDSDDEIHEFYERLKDVSEQAPKINEKYQIYHFFASDPENRRIEVQRFLHPLPDQDQ